MLRSRVTVCPRRPSFRTAAARVCLLAAALSVPGCGGDSSSFPPTLVTSTVFEYNVAFEGLDRFGFATADFTVPAAGTLDISVDWASPTDDIDLSLSNQACDIEGFFAGVCKVLATETSNLKPARMILATTATSYRLFVVNLGPGRESGTIAVKVTQSRIEF